MLIEILLAILLGIFLGVFTGLTPGVHINLLGAILISLTSVAIFQINPIYFVAIIASMAITHTMIDFIPSVFLGCPDTETELAVLPGHEMLKEGRGYEAIVLTLYGGLSAIIIFVLISFPAIFIFSKIYSVAIKTIPYVLILASIFLIFIEKNKFSASFVFFLSGILGLFVLNFGIKEPLLPLLTGLFGSSMILLSIKNKVKIPKQEITLPKIKSAKPLFGSLIASLLCGFLPGLGSGQAAIIGTTISKSNKKEDFLFLLGATNVLVMGFSFLSLYAISRTRTGAAAAINEIIGALNTNTLLLIIGIVLISGFLSFFLSLLLVKQLVNKISKINYTFLSKIVLMMLVVVIISFSGMKGFFVFVISTLTGVYCISLKVRRTQMMGCLLLPTIIFYLSL